MKQYTNESQTAKLIELGFEKPTMKNIPTLEGEINEEWYSIGELIEMLPECTIVGMKTWHIVQYDKEYYYGRDELIDALYFLIVELKENKII